MAFRDSSTAGGKTEFRRTSTVQRRVSGLGEHEDSFKQRIPYDADDTQKLHLRKSIIGESAHEARANSQSKRSVNRMRSGKTSDGGDGKLSLGLLQQYNQLEESSDPAGPSEVSDGKYMNKRMRLAAAMDSIYVNLLVISLVLLDVISIAYFELQAWKDCFDRDFPAQEAITIFCVSGYTIELLLRGIGNGFRNSYAPKKQNLNNILDAAIVSVSVVIGGYKVWDDRSKQLLCPPGLACSNGDSRLVCQPGSFCLDGVGCRPCTLPPAPYTEKMDMQETGAKMCTFVAIAAIAGAKTSDLQAARTGTTAIRVVSLVLRVMRAIRMLMRVVRLTDQIKAAVRSRLSKNTERYQNHGFDLDLTYITSRLICMAAPSTRMTAGSVKEGNLVFLNDAFQVAKFFASRHYNNFRVFNFCAEELGSYATQRLFDQVTRVPVPQKRAPALLDLLIFCENAVHYLLLDELNVILLHCDAGRDRSGVFAGSFLLYSGHCTSSREAISLFTNARFGQISHHDVSQQVMAGASLTRMVKYVEDVIHGSREFSPVELAIDRIHFPGMTSFSGLTLQVSCNGVVLFDSSDEASNQAFDTKDGIGKHSAAPGFLLSPIVIQGDTSIAVFRQRKQPSASNATGIERHPDFLVQFHTAFVQVTGTTRRAVTFARDDIDFVGGPEQDIEVAVSFAEEDPKSMKMLERFRSLIRSHGVITNYKKGDVIVQRGELVPCIRLLLQGHVSEIAPRDIMSHVESVSGKQSESDLVSVSDVTTVGIYGRGQLFAFRAFCAGIPDCKCLCASRTCQVASIELNWLEESEEAIEAMEQKKRAKAEDVTEKDLEEQASGHSNSRWHLPGISDQELPGFLKVLSQQLLWQVLSIERTRQTFSTATQFNEKVDLMMERVEKSAINLFRLPAHEKCVHIQRCEVCERGGNDNVANRVVFLTNYILLDRRLDGETPNMSTDMVFGLDELSATKINFPYVTIVFFTLGGMDFEASCGTQSNANSFHDRLQEIMGAKHVHFRRLLFEGLGNPDAYGNHVPEFSTFFELAPKFKAQHNEALVNCGSSSKDLIFVTSGSVMLLDEGRVVKIVKAGEFIGIYEYILNIRAQFTAKVRSEDGVWAIRVSRSLLDSQLKSQPALATRFFQYVARHAAQELYYWLIRDYPSAVFAYKLDVYTPPGFEPVEDGNHEKTETDNWRQLLEQPIYTRDMKMMKLLKLRKSEVLKHIDNFGISMLASGMRSRKLSPGQILMRQGEKASQSKINSMYLVKAGILDVYVGGERVASLGHGEIVGERALFLQEDRSATVQAKTGVLLGEIRLELVQQLISTDPKLTKAIKKIFGSKVGGLRPQEETGAKELPPTQGQGVPMRSASLFHEQPRALQPSTGAQDRQDVGTLHAVQNANLQQDRWVEENKDQHEQIGSQTRGSSPIHGPARRMNGSANVAECNGPRSSPQGVQLQHDTSRDRLIELANLGATLGIVPHQHSDCYHEEHDSSDESPSRTLQPAPAFLESGHEAGGVARARAGGSLLAQSDASGSASEL